MLHLHMHWVGPKPPRPRPRRPALPTSSTPSLATRGSPPSPRPTRTARRAKGVDPVGSGGVGGVEQALAVELRERRGALEERRAAGASGMLAFKRRASALGIVTLASVSITGGANDESDFSEQTEALRASGATVIVIFAGGYDASLFIEKAYDAGVGGPGFLWLGSDAVSQASTMARIEDPTVRRHVFQADTSKTLPRHFPDTSQTLPRHSLGLLRPHPVRKHRLARLPAVQPEPQRHALHGGRRRRQLRLGDRRRRGADVGGGQRRQRERRRPCAECTCAAPRGEPGLARAVGNASTPLACSGSDNQQLDIYAMYSYDATFALAHALHRLVEHARVAEARGACAHAAPTRTGPCTPPGSSLSTLRREGRLPPLVSMCVCECVWRSQPGEARHALTLGARRRADLTRTVTRTLTLTPGARRRALRGARDKRELRGRDWPHRIQRRVGRRHAARVARGRPRWREVDPTSAEDRRTRRGGRTATARRACGTTSGTLARRGSAVEAGIPFPPSVCVHTSVSEWNRRSSP